MKEEIYLIEQLEKSKEYIATITAIITLVLFFKNFISFMSSTEFERQFFSKEKKFLFEITSFFIVFILLPTIYLFALFHEFESIKSFTYSIFFSANALLFIIFLFLLSILKIVFIISKKRNKNYRIFNNKAITIIHKIGKILLSVTTFFLYGLLNVYILTYYSSLSIKFTLIMVFSFLELYFIYVIYKGIIDIEFTKAMLVTIELDNSQIYSDYFIYYPTGNFLLIGKNESIKDCKDPILINIDKIISCKKVTKKSTLIIL